MSSGLIRWQSARTLAMRGGVVGGSSSAAVRLAPRADE